MITMNMKQRGQMGLVLDVDQIPIYIAWSEFMGTGDLGMDMRVSRGFSFSFPSFCFLYFGERDMGGRQVGWEADWDLEMPVVLASFLSGVAF